MDEQNINKEEVNVENNEEVKTENTKNEQKLDLENEIKESFGDLNGIDIDSINLDEIDTSDVTIEDLNAQLEEMEAQEKLQKEAEEKARREEEEKNRPRTEEEIAERRKKLASIFELNVSKDSMAAYLRIKKPAAPAAGQPEEEPIDIEPEDIIRFLESRDVTYGIREKAINEFCEKKRFYAELKCAVGKEAVHQEAAHIEFDFETEKNIKPKENEDGTVDFRNLGLIQTVDKGQLLCHVVVPPEGTDGIDIYNHVIPYKPCKIPQLPSGQNTVVSEDKLTLTSAVDGSVEYLRNKVEVQPVFVVNGDVDNSSGNIEFFGSVTVNGDVREGFVIKAGKEVIVKGIVEGATIEAGEDVKLLKGMNGMGKGTIRAGGDISGKFFENAILKCEGDLYSDSLLHCRVETGGAVHLKGNKSVLVGGECKAGTAVFGYNIGTPSGIKTLVSVGVGAAEKAAEMENNLKLQNKLNNDIQKAEESLNELQAKLAIFKERIAKKVSGDKDIAVFKILLTQKSAQAANIAELKKQLAELKEEQVDFDCSDLKIVGKRIVYPGVKLVIGPFTMFVEQEYNATKFYASEEKIEFAPATAADNE
ncbi:MAG: FapA family protein [Clostridiales bacterium]|nr:FapA family protein [Clostridiales bacterium]